MESWSGNTKYDIIFHLKRGPVVIKLPFLLRAFESTMVMTIVFILKQELKSRIYISMLRNNRVRIQADEYPI